MNDWQSNTKDNQKTTTDKKRGQKACLKGDSATGFIVK